MVLHGIQKKISSDVFLWNMPSKPIFVFPISLKFKFLEKCSNKQFNWKISTSWDFYSYTLATIIAKKWPKPNSNKKDLNVKVKYYNWPPMKRCFRFIVFRFHGFIHTCHCYKLGSLRDEERPISQRAHRNLPDNWRWGEELVALKSLE